MPRQRTHPRPAWIPGRGSFPRRQHLFQALRREHPGIVSRHASTYAAASIVLRFHDRSTLHPLCIHFSRLGQPILLESKQMNANIITSICLMVFFVNPCFGQSLLNLDSLQLKDGRKYQNVSITTKNSDGISFSHSEGMSRVGFEDLPDDVAKKLGISSLDVEEHIIFKANQKAQRIESQKAYDAERIRLRDLQLEEEKRRREAQAEAQRIAAQEAADRRREQQIAEARKRAEAEKMEQEMLRINPNYKRIQGLQQLRDQIFLKIQNLPEIKPVNGNRPIGHAGVEESVQLRQQLIAQYQRELRLIDDLKISLSLDLPQEQLNTNPNSKRIQELQLLRNQILEKTLNLPQGGDIKRLEQEIFRIQQDLRLIDDQILALSPDRPQEQVAQLRQHRELRDQQEVQEQARQQQQAMQEQLAREAEQMRAETEKMRRDMAALRFQQEQNAAEQRRRIQELEWQRQLDEQERRSAEWRRAQGW